MLRMIGRQTGEREKIVGCEEHEKCGAAKIPAGASAAQSMLMMERRRKQHIIPNAPRERESDSTSISGTCDFAFERYSNRRTLCWSRALRWSFAASSLSRSLKTSGDTCVRARSEIVEKKNSSGGKFSLLSKLVANKARLLLVINPQNHPQTS